MQDDSPASPHCPTNEVESSESTTLPLLAIEAADSFNYAAWQNAVPLLRSVAIDNSGGLELSSLVVELRASPGFARDKRWTIGRAGAGEKLTLKDVDLDIDPAYLDGLDESERGVLSFQLLQKGTASPASGWSRSRSSDSSNKIAASRAERLWQENCWSSKRWTLRRSCPAPRPPKNRWERSCGLGPQPKSRSSFGTRLTIRSVAALTRSRCPSLWA